MKQILSAGLLAFILTACGISTPVPIPTGTETALPATTAIKPTLTATQPLPTNTQAPTSTASLQPCDAVVSYCILDGHFWLASPISPPSKMTIDPGYPYGSTEGGKLEPHHGVEFYNGSGTPVLAAADGKVAVEGNDLEQVYALKPNTYGNLVVLEHRFPGFTQPIYTLYGHLSKINVQPGQNVHMGDKIGEVGATGIAVGSHLHFEVREGRDDYDSNRNPVLWLQPLASGNDPQYGVLAGSLEDTHGFQLPGQSVNIQFFLDPKGEQADAWQVDTYSWEEHPVQSDDKWHENFTLGNLRAGTYRISMMWGGVLWEKWVEVRPGKLTLTTLKVGQ